MSRRNSAVHGPRIQLAKSMTFQRCWTSASTWTRKEYIFASMEVPFKVCVKTFIASFLHPKRQLECLTTSVVYRQRDHSFIQTIQLRYQRANHLFVQKVSSRPPMYYLCLDVMSGLEACLMFLNNPSAPTRRMSCLLGTCLILHDSRTLHLRA